MVQCSIGIKNTEFGKYERITVFMMKHIFLFLILTPTLLAQEAQPLGDTFIFFVDATNARIPATDGLDVAEDPFNIDNFVARFTGEDRSTLPSFRWIDSVGVDMSANRAEGDSLFLRLWVAPANVGDDGTPAPLYLIFQDREQVIADGDGSNDDVPFRAIWPIPDSMMIGSWFNLALPLPPATVAGLDSVRALPSPDPFLTNWQYPGGFHADLDTFIDDPTSPLWQEFQWDAVTRLGFLWDQESGPAGPVLVDDVYIGRSDTDLSTVFEPGPAYAGTVTVTNEDHVAFASFTPDPNAGGYRVYVSDAPITETSVFDATQTVLLAELGPQADSLAVRFPVFTPHPSFGRPTVYFGVTNLTGFGVENPVPVTASLALDGKPQPFVFELTPAQVDVVFTAFAEGRLSVDGLPLETFAPFRMDRENGTSSDLFPDDDSDFSVRTWMAFAPDPEDPTQTLIWLYADVDDEVLVFAENDGQGQPLDPDAFRYDGLLLQWGKYQVAPLVASPNQAFGTNAFPDYSLRLTPLQDGGDNVTGVYDEVAWAGGQSPLQGLADPLIEIKMDASGIPTGYRVMAVYRASEITLLNPDFVQTDPFVRPEPDEVLLYPVLFAGEDQDGDPQGDWLTNRHVLITGERPNTAFSGDDTWLTNPSTWPAIAFAGQNAPTVDDEDEALSRRFTLDQNYPNPFQSTTRIAFELPESDNVSLAVYNLLGQTVATLVDEVLPAGIHAVSFDARDLPAGLYVYRLRAGGLEIVRKMTRVR